MKQQTQKQLREEEKQFKAILTEVRGKLIKQDEEYFKLFLLPNDDLIKAIDWYLRKNWKYNKGYLSKEELMFKIDKRNERVKEMKEYINKNGI